ncbi:CD3324 family protein [Oceanirhabdus sp. W0125-5]|uniref:CD3324 family protein n=1 Tax=Oceanirhabdus sp. W0125-5 TaxID=2999116 RepID=UPI0022F3037C|nr:CD3324 family protein [Oceanirhabdus sp. W0125-5]WBW97297.1 CD3324 family protein [Oceanirhabdus sp. W0125-5]
MKHIKAENVLPEEVINIIQEYVDGEYIYIPRKNSNQKSWGEKNGIKDEFKKRNLEIYNRFNQGRTIKGLAKEYYLSEQSIRRIVRQQNMLCS